MCVAPGRRHCESPCSSPPIRIAGCPTYTFSYIFFAENDPSSTLIGNTSCLFYGGELEWRFNVGFLLLSERRISLFALLRIRLRTSCSTPSERANMMSWATCYQSIVRAAYSFHCIQSRHMLWRIGVVEKPPNKVAFVFTCSAHPDS